MARVRAEGALSVTPQTLQMGTGSAEAVLSLSGPPLARAITVTADTSTLRMEYDDHYIKVATTGSAGDGQLALLTVTSPTGSVDVTVAVTEATDEDSPSVAVGVSPAPTATPVSEETETLPVIHERTSGGGRRRGLLALASALVVAVVGVVTWGLTRGPDDGPPGFLPQGSPLSDQVMVWVASSNDGDAIVSGSPSGPERTLVPTAEETLRYPAISPDRRTVAFLRISASQGGDLYVVGSDGAGERRLDPSASCPNRGRPSWSPDGNQLVTICFAADGSRLGVAVLALNGPTRMLTEDPMAMTPDWSPTGDFVVYSAPPPASDATDQLALWAVPVEGGQAEQLTGGNRDLYPAVDPTGQWVAFTRVQAGTGRLYKLDLRSHEETPLTSPKQGIDKEPTWSPKGETIAFQRGQSVALVPAIGDHQATHLPGREGTIRHMISWH